MQTVSLVVYAWICYLSHNKHGLVAKEHGDVASAADRKPMLVCWKGSLPSVVGTAMGSTRTCIFTCT